MSFAFMPVYTGDYLRDTRHLTPLKHGIYLLLLMHCWDQRGPLPRDEQECAGVANCRSADEVDALRYVLSRYFVLMEDGWYNKRMQIEVERAESISRARSDAGRAGYEARAKQLPSKSQASASTPTTTPTTTTTLTPTTTGGGVAVVVQNSTVEASLAVPRARAKTLAAPTNEHRQIAHERGIDCDKEWAAYCDWQAANGKNHKDQAAGFRNWLRRARSEIRGKADKRAATAAWMDGKSEKVING